MFSGSEREEVAFENLNCPVRLLALYMWWSPPLSGSPDESKVSQNEGGFGGVG